MNIYMALVLFASGVFIFIQGIRAGILHNGRNRQNDAYFVMSLSTSVWVTSLAIMMLCPPEQSKYFAAASIWGAINFTVQILLFMMSVYENSVWYKAAYVVCPILGNGLWVLRVFCDSYDMVETKYGYFQIDKVCMVNYIFYAYIFLLAFGMIIALAYCVRRATLKREKICFNIWIFLIIVFAVVLNGVSVFNMYQEIPTSPMEGIYACIANFCFYFIAGYADMLEMPRTKVESYITEYLAIPVVFVDYQGNIIYCNEAYENYFHVKKENVLGTQQFYDSICADVSVGGAGAGMDAEKKGKGSFRAWTPDGGRVMEVRYSVLYDRFGEEKCVINIVNDITDEEILLYDLELQRTLAEEKTQEAIRANQTKSIFLARMSHEIRTPMNAILGMNEMVMRETISPKVSEYSQDIYNAGQTLLSIINDILDLSKIESGKMEIVPVTYELSSLLNDVLNMVAKKVADKNLQLETDIAKDIPYQLCGDEVRVRQIVLNLINNAVKYTRQGSVTMQVDWQRKEEKQLELQVSIKDTGVGIKPEDMESLFESFHRVDIQANYDIEGTGLGLSIVKQLVNQMGGTVSVDSVYGEGSVFTVCIPQGIVNETPMGDFSEAYRKMRRNQDRKLEHFEAPEAKILIVDDNRVNLAVAKGLLKETKIQIDMVLSGREALERIKAKEYHIILLDHMMPEMDGIETLHCMKVQEENASKNAAIIAMTANAISGSREQYLAEGFHDYLSKPIDTIRYLSVVKKYLPEELVHSVERTQEDAF